MHLLLQKIRLLIEYLVTVGSYFGIMGKDKCHSHTVTPLFASTYFNLMYTFIKFIHTTDTRGLWHV